MSDGAYIFHWWIMIFALGVIFLPITFSIFSNFFDKGYIFSKILGIIFISYLVFTLGILHIGQFTPITILACTIFLGIINAFFVQKVGTFLLTLKNNWKIFIIEEFIFTFLLFSLSIIRATAPDIHGLEKYMDFGFINSILRSTYFPPADMWYTPFSINYYYFGHLATATLTKLSGIPANITFNLMLGTIFSFCFLTSFSLCANFVHFLLKEKKITAILSGFLAGFLTTFAGNIHTIYTFFKPYDTEKPVPFWQLPFSFNTFPNSYWYPNATRFIYHTIHEFPIYSFVVSDLHGHVLDIPFVLLTISTLFALFITKNEEGRFSLISTIFVGFLLAILYMTNAWDGIIYLLLSMLIFLFKSKEESLIGKVLDPEFIKKITILIGSFFIFSLPFSIFFKPFASGIGVLCAPSFLTDKGKIGPLLFEANHCQHSPWWQLLILYGFFYFWVIAFLIFLLKRKKAKNLLKIKFEITEISDKFILILIGLSTLLIIIPEFIYLKDIYPEHYRANTMFKLVYQSFIMLSVSSSYIIVRLLTSLKLKKINIGNILFSIVAIFILALVSIYPYFSINSYYGNLQTYYGLDGTKYLQKLYPSDYAAIDWINKNITGTPVMLEAQGDSYTDYERVSSNTGLPTILGWTVHEWLWRGGYDPLPERINDVQKIYESSNAKEVKDLLIKYNVSYIFIGEMEHRKYTNLDLKKFSELGKIIYQNNQTIVYKVK